MAVSPTWVATRRSCGAVLIAVPTQAKSGLLVFDGDCGFCTTSANWIARRLHEPSIVAPWQHLDLTEIGLSADDVATSVWWIDDNGPRHCGSAAIAQSLMAIGGFWKTVGLALHHPPGRWFGKAIYPIVAKYRHRLPGGTAACKLDG